MERAEGSELSAEGKRAAGARLSEPRPNQLSESGSALGEESPDRADATEPRATESLDSGPSSLDSFQPLPLDPPVPVGLVVEMDLPELGLTDLAWVTDIADCPEIESRDSGRSAGGSVVTATFHHSSGDVIDLTLGSKPSSLAPPETIGTTSNHPFWSVDRQEYVQAGQLDVGERVLTFSGDTKRVVTKLPRPGPQPVFNLEVHAEHVYFVGEDGLLVHNAGKVYRGMKIDADGKPVVEPSARGLGVRSGETGMSTAPAPGKLPRHRRPKEFGGTGNDPVFEIDEADLPVGLRIHHDSSNHANIEALHSIPESQLNELLKSTRDKWRRVYPDES